MGQPRSNSWSNFWWSGAYAVALAGLGIIAYASALHAPFLLDDKMHIVRDDAIKPPMSILRLLSHDRPVVTLSLAANYAFGKLDVVGYHLVNVGAHIGVGLLLFGLAHRTFRLTVMRDRDGRVALALAAATAAIFLLHPVQTESVTYVVQRAEIFATLALLGALWMGASMALRPPSTPRRRRTAGALLTLASLAAFGSFSKESAVVLPVLFGLYDWCFLAAGRVRPMLRRWPIYATLITVVGVAAALRWWQALSQDAALGGVDLSAFHFEPGAAVVDTHAITPGRYLRWQFGVILYYLWLMFVPTRLCFDCGYLGPWPVQASVLDDRVWLPALALAAIVAAAWHLRRRQPLATFCVLGTLVALAPTSSVLPLTDVYVEHRLYLPIAFMALFGVAGAYSASRAAVQRGWVNPAVARALRVVALVTVLGALGALTIIRNHLYADPLRLWEDSVAKAPQSERALFNLANEYARRGQTEQAVGQFQELIRLYPGPTYYVNLAQRYLELNRNTDAVTTLETARQLAPTWGIIERKLAVAYGRVGRLAEAVAAADRGTQLEPLYAPGYQLLGDSYRRMGRDADARKAYETARTLQDWERHGGLPPTAPPGH